MSRDNSNQWRVFVTRPIADAPLRRLARVARVDLWDDNMPPPPDEIRLRLRGTDAVLSLLTDRIDAETIASAPRLRVISNMAVGVDNIDVGAATRAGIPVGHTPGILTETTADLAFALLMAAARRVVEGDRHVRANRWRTWGPQTLLGHDVFGATLGIIGWGAIGQAMARRAAGFNMKVLYTAHRPAAGKARKSHVSREIPAGPPSAPRRVSLPRLLAESDFISLHVPLTAETRHLLGAHEFARMKRSAIVVNTSRGPVIDQAALAAALRTGRIAGAALDVTDPEPIAPDDPLLELENVVITPHIGSASYATREMMANVAVENILAVMAGRLPPFCANPAVRLRPSTANRA
ncbi:MAG TPA: D-glycerate dehydrogenase [Candidatus Binataceae bacterium]|nr:D-glycerate dehydrogenase [Candidatus Binataceae bacterium]